LDRTVPFVRAALDGTPAEAAAILQDAERRHGLRWLAVPDNRPEDNSDEWYRAHLWPFLTDTHMVLAAGDLQASGCSLLDPAGVDHFPTWRYWGQVVAGWANRHWAPRPARGRWGYLDFYDHAYLSTLIAGYDGWCAAVWQVLALTGNGEIPVVG
jgi:hypothetical protein